MPTVKRVLHDALVTLGVMMLGLIVGLYIGVSAGWGRGYDQGVEDQTKLVRSENRSKAMAWAKAEMKRHCPAWFDDRRSTKMVACFKPKWMQE